MNSRKANMLFQESLALLQAGKAVDALKILSKLDQSLPSNPSVLFLMGTGYSISGNKSKAIQTYDRVLRLNPQFIEAYNNIALDLAYCGDHEKAIGYIDKAIELRPDFIEGLNNKGCFLNAIGLYSEACDCFDAALRIKSDDTMALANLSISLIHLGHYDKARSCSEKLLSINPTDYKGHSNLGKISLKLEDHEAALSHFLSANKYNPSDVDSLADLGTTLTELDRFDEANRFFKEALSLRHDHGATYVGLGLLNHDLRNFDQAIAYFEAPIQDKYRLTLREYNRALTHLHLGNLSKGWIDYEWRWRESNLPVPYLQTTNEIWNGKVTAEPLFIWHEQGIGDQILFGSLLPELASLSTNTIVRIDERLVSIFQRSFPKVCFLPHNQPLPDSAFKYHLPAGNLPSLFRESSENFGRQINPFLHADSMRSGELRRRLGTNKTIVGLAWMTKGKHSRQRNLPIDQIVSVIQKTLPSVLVDLQYSDTTEDRLRIANTQGITIKHLEEVDNFNDIDGLAALLNACDIIVTCSNSTAHLAGALGKETYLLLPFSRGRHWYWSHADKTSHSLWYPTVRLIPQTCLGQWEQPIETLSTILSARYLS